MTPNERGARLMMWQLAERRRADREQNAVRGGFHKIGLAGRGCIDGCSCDSGSVVGGKGERPYQHRHGALCCCRCRRRQKVGPDVGVGDLRRRSPARQRAHPPFHPAQQADVGDKERGPTGCGGGVRRRWRSSRCTMTTARACSWSGKTDAAGGGGLGERRREWYDFSPAASVARTSSWGQLPPLQRPLPLRTAASPCPCG